MFKKEDSQISMPFKKKNDGKDFYMMCTWGPRTRIAKTGGAGLGVLSPSKRLRVGDLHKLSFAEFPPHTPYP